MADGSTRAPSYSSSFPRVRTQPFEAVTDFAEVRDLLQKGDLKRAGPTIEQLMTGCAGIARLEVVLLYGEYLLRCGRPFSATRVLRSLNKRFRNNFRFRLLHAKAMADMGRMDLARAAGRELAKSPGENRNRAKQLVAEIDGILTGASAHKQYATNVSAFESTLGLTGDALFTPPALKKLDEHLGNIQDMDEEMTEVVARQWGFFFGEYLVRRFGAQWRWSLSPGLSRIKMPLRTGSLELFPDLWIMWSLSRPEHQLSEFVRVLLELAGVEQAEIEMEAGSPSGFLQGDTSEQPPEPLSEALRYAVEVASRGIPVRGLGLHADCPWCRLRVPLLLETQHGPTAVLFVTDPKQKANFERYLDMLSLSQYGQTRWSVRNQRGRVSHPSLQIYEAPDRAVRAALVARRMCTPNPSENARWATIICEMLLKISLDGRPSTIAMVQEAIIDQIRPGGRARWGVLYENRSSILFMLTCYLGEILRNRYGGRWGVDRLSGQKTGPTAGLELPDLRYNLGIQVLKTFHNGKEDPLLPSTIEYARRAQS